MAALQGSCLCGGVRFEVTEAPDTLRYCHCESCKKLSGGAATVNGRVPSTAIRILEGEDLLQTFQPPEGSAKTFCLACGSNLFGGGWPESDEASVELSLLALLLYDQQFVLFLIRFLEFPDLGLIRRVFLPPLA